MVPGWSIREGAGMGKLARAMALAGAFLLSAVMAAPVSAQKSPQPEQLLTRIAFGSCAHQELPQPVWDAVLAYKPELFLFTGDNVYGDILGGKTVPEGEVLSSLAIAYAKAETIPGYRALRETVPHLAVWDDHDYGKNDGGGEFVHRDASQKMFVNFWKLRENDPRQSRAGLYHAETYGPQGRRVQVILLDTRSFRSAWKPTDQRGAKGRERYIPDADPDKTMLGTVQWAWLAERLQEPADIRIVVSSIQVLAEEHGFERWAAFPAERARLLALLQEAKGQVVIVSGDRHIGAVYQQPTQGAVSLAEVTSSGLTHAYAGADEPGANRVGALFGAPNFGTFEIDWWAGTLTMSVRAINGEPVRQHRLDLIRRP